jgi:hypothetical protein
MPTSSLRRHSGKSGDEVKRRRRAQVSITQYRRRWSFYMTLCRRADVIVHCRGVPVMVLVGKARFRRLAEAAAQAEDFLRRESVGVGEKQPQRKASSRRGAR